VREQKEPSLLLPQDDIINYYQLYRKSQGYEDGFLDGFEDGFYDGYDDGYAVIKESL